MRWGWYSYMVKCIIIISNTWQHFSSPYVMQELCKRPNANKIVWIWKIRSFYCIRGLIIMIQNFQNIFDYPVWLFWNSVIDWRFWLYWFGLIAGAKFWIALLDCILARWSSFCFLRNVIESAITTKTWKEKSYENLWEWYLPSIKDFIQHDLSTALHAAIIFAWWVSGNHA